MTDRHIGHHLKILLAALFALLFAYWQELRDKRKRPGLSLEGAAERCCVDPSTYARWEKGKQVPHPKNLAVIQEQIDPYDDVWYAEMSYVPDAYLAPSYWND